MKVHAWHVDPNGIQNKNNFKYPYLIGIKTDEILIIDTQIVYIKINKYIPILVQHKCIPHATYMAARGKGTLPCADKVGKTTICYNFGPLPHGNIS